jgi:hypothetical protein
MTGLDDEKPGNGMIVTDFSGEGGAEDEAFDLGDGGSDDTELSAEDMQAGIPRTADLSGNEPPAQATTQPAVQPTGRPPQETQQPITQIPAPGAQQQPAPGSQAQEQPTANFESYVRENFATLTEQLATTTFALTDEEKAVFGDAAPHVPKLVSKMFLMTQVANQRAIAAALPQMVAGLVQVSNRGVETETKFFNDYPVLKDVPRQTLANLGHALRQSNPTMPVAEFFPLMARTAAAMLGKQLTPVRGKAQPFTPAGSGPRGTPAPRGAPRRQVGVDNLGNINNLLRDGD